MDKRGNKRIISPNEDVSFEERRSKEKKMIQKITSHFSRLNIISFSDPNQENETGSISHLERVTYLYNSEAPGAKSLRNALIMKNLISIEKFITNSFRMDLHSVELAIKRNYQPIIRNINPVSSNKVELDFFFLIFIKSLRVFKWWYTKDYCLSTRFISTNDILLILCYGLEESKQSRTHVGPVLKRLNLRTMLLTRMDLKIIMAAGSMKLSSRRLNYLFAAYRESKYHFNIKRLLEGISKVISNHSVTYCRHCFKSKSNTTEEMSSFEKSHFDSPFGKPINFSKNLIQKVMESNHFAQIAFEHSFEEFDPGNTGKCKMNHFVEGCSMVLNQIKKVVSTDTSFQDLVTLLRCYQLPISNMASWVDFKKETFCGCIRKNTVAQVCYILSNGKANQDQPDEDLQSEEESSEEQKNSPETNNNIRHESSNERIPSSNVKHLWRNSPIEIVGSIPSTSAIWEQYCEKFSSSSEESFSSLTKEEDHPIPLNRKYGFTDVRKVEEPLAIDVDTTECENVSSKYSRREEYERTEWVAMTQALIKFRQCLKNVVGDCISYVRCLDPEQKGFISFEEFVEVLVTFGIFAEDHVIFSLEEWFNTPRGLDYRSMMEALYELNQCHEELEENQSNDVWEEEEIEEEFTTHQDEKENQDASLQNVMEQYQTMTENALMRIRVAVFESGILMMDLFQAHDVDNVGFFTRQEFYKIVSPLVKLSEELWTMIMYKYCRPFEPSIIPYRPFADDIDCNSKEPDVLLLPLGYLNTSIQNGEHRKKVTWVIERLGRTATLDQIKQLFGGVSDRCDALLTEKQYLTAISSIRFITISEKELLFRCFSVEEESATFFDYKRFWKCCRYVHMTYYMGVYTSLEN